MRNFSTQNNNEKIERHSEHVTTMEQHGRQLNVALEQEQERSSAITSTTRWACTMQVAQCMRESDRDRQADNELRGRHNNHNINHEQNMKKWLQKKKCGECQVFQKKESLLFMLVLHD